MVPALETANKLHPRVLMYSIIKVVIGATHVVNVEKAKEAIEMKLGYKFEKSHSYELNFKALEQGIDSKEDGGGIGDRRHLNI